MYMGSSSDGLSYWRTQRQSACDAFTIIFYFIIFGLEMNFRGGAQVGVVYNDFVFKY